MQAFNLFRMIYFLQVLQRKILLKLNHNANAWATTCELKANLHTCERRLLVNQIYTCLQKLACELKLTML